MISVKKLATIGAAAGLLLGSAIPAFADHWDDLNINQTNQADIENNILANSNTGNQSIGDGGWSFPFCDGDPCDSEGNFALGTGNAATVVEVANVANSNDADVDSCGCFDDVTINQTNTANIGNNILANSNSGNQSFGDGSNLAIHTGNAFTGVAVANVVNSNVAVVD